MKEVLSNLTSPAKLAFAAYVLLVYKSSDPPPWWVHGIVFVAFILLQVWHDDYLRIRLNYCAEIASVRDARKAQVTAEEIAAIRGRNDANKGLPA